MSTEPDEEPNDPGNEDPGSLMDEAQVPLIDPEDAAEGGDPHPSG
ncbi:MULTISPECIES: hypothetical protein [Pseudomonas]|nr:hypothetical protein [Pseudomonas sp. FP597]EFQ63202.1 hypothetical protein PFWH6_2879 [Pseudomonas fluorescens WH6]WLI04057.1 hypothetical protein PSH66_15645 [Pseudomonas sp. FP597]